LPPQRTNSPSFASSKSAADNSLSKETWLSRNEQVLWRNGPSRNGKEATTRAVLAGWALKSRERDQPAELIRRTGNGALQGAKRGATLTQRMLAFARQHDLKPGSADTAELLAGMRELLERTLGSQIESIIEAPATPPPARVDADQIELAILNLVINARDAMADGGQIRIGVEHCLVAESWADDEKFLCISVIDTGTGMDNETLRKAVEPFFSTKPVGKGTGLGLSMVHGLAAQLGCMSM
jgi:signal transduction histidine kinase